MQAHSTRIHHLDTLRGVAVLGILLMNGVSFGLGTTAYFNVSVDVDESILDRVIGIAGEILVDQKFMALFSILFGAGVVLFHERLQARQGKTRALRISLWRNILLLLIGIVHSLFWNGDVLVIYAIAAPLVLAVRNLPGSVLFTSGVLIISLSPLLAMVVQPGIGAQGEGLGEYWIDPRSRASDAVNLWLITDFTARALGMMLIGIGLYRTGFLHGNCATRLYRLTALLGITIGLSLATSGVIWLTARDFAASVALIGSIPNTLGTLPAVLGYLAVISLWSRHASTHWLLRIRAVGRMALTNYLSQTLLGMLFLRHLVGPDHLSRSVIVVFVLLVWTAQLWWSSAWLERYQYGPIEWLWRCATHRRLLPLRLDHRSEGENHASQEARP